MADVRLIVVLAVACSDAGAQPPPSPPIKPPTGWTAQPAIAAAAKEALGKKAKLDGIEAFGEPAQGCYAVTMALRGSGNAKELAAQVVRGLTPDPKEKKRGRELSDIKDVVMPTADEGVLSLSFESAPYKGKLRARLAKGSIRALACFWSPREPKICEAACTGLLGALP